MELELISFKSLTNSSLPLLQCVIRQNTVNIYEHYYQQMSKLYCSNHSGGGGGGGSGACGGGGAYSGGGDGGGGGGEISHHLKQFHIQSLLVSKTIAD